MRFTSLLFSGAICASTLHVAVLGSPQPQASASKRPSGRTKPLLISPPGLPDLPSPEVARVAAQAASLNIDNIQGDVIAGMKKPLELFYFFTINDPDTFKAKLRSDIHSLITSATDLLATATQPITAVNFGLSKVGLDTLRITEELGDTLFNAGQEDGIGPLGDHIDNWVPQFRNKGVHGVFLLASDTLDNINNELANIQSILGSSINEVYRLEGAARTGDQEGHEFFGFKDGISQPAIEGFGDAPLPGQQSIPPGVIILGADGDRVPRPAWAKDGSIFVFRQLQQMVPEFNQYVESNAPGVDGLTHDESVALFGARMVGRWKSGAPVDLSPLRDDPDLANDKLRNNDFTFNHTDPDFNFTLHQTFCPFSAHIRKVNPRLDLPNQTNLKENRILRSSIPYGPEVTSEEESSHATSTERGLAFVAYQTDLNSGFFFIQGSWANNPGFIFTKDDRTPGYDPIIGAVSLGDPGPRNASGLDRSDPTHDFTLPDFVVSRGGEYFFAPPLSAIASGFSDAK